MRIVRRSQWGARPPKTTPVSLGRVATVVIHHDTGSKPTSFEAEKARMRTDQNYHMDSPDRGYNDIAYSFGVGPSGHVFEGRGWGVVAAATENWNEVSYGIDFQGNFETEFPTGVSLKNCGVLIRRGVRNGSIAKDYKVIGHRDTKATACPGANLYAKLDRIKHFSQPPVTRFLVTATKVVAGEKRARALAERLRERGFSVTREKRK